MKLVDTCLPGNLLHKRMHKRYFMFLDFCPDSGKKQGCYENPGCGEKFSSEAQSEEAD